MDVSAVRLLTKDTVSNPGEPDPPPVEVPEGWDAAAASQDFEVVEGWYTANTGHEKAGYTQGELTSGSCVSSVEGQLFEAVASGNARWLHNDVTYLGCRFTWDTSLYAAYGNPTFQNPFSGITFRYCTFDGPNEAPDTARRAAVISAVSAGAVKFEYCNFFGGTSGIANDSAAGGALVDYCWVHDLAAATSENGAHRTCMRATVGGGRFYRDYCTDGGSSCISVYFDKRDIHNFTVQENILNGSSPNASPSYLINTKSGAYGPTALNVKYLGNMFGTSYQFGVATGGNVPWGTNGNERTGNKMFETGELIFND